MESGMKIKIHELLFTAHTDAVQCMPH